MTDNEPIADWHVWRIAELNNKVARLEKENARLREALYYVWDKVLAVLKNEEGEQDGL